MCAAKLIAAGAFYLPLPDLKEFFGFFNFIMRFLFISQNTYLEFVALLI